MIKVLLLTHSANITGGAEDDFQRIANYLFNTNKYKIHILCPLGYRYDIYADSAHGIDSYKIGWFPVIKARMRSYIKYAYIGLKQIIEIRQKIGKSKYDVVVVNVSVLFFPLLFFWAKRVKSVVFIRETITPLVLRKYYYKILSSISNHFIGVSKFNTNDFVSITRNKNADMLYSSIETEDERIIDSEFELKLNLKESIVSELYSKENFKILLNGNVCERKNQLLALQALVQIVNELKIQNVRMFFAGDTNSDKVYFNKLKEFVKSNNLEGYVYFLGSLKKTTIYKLYESIQLTIMTSFSEGLPLVLVESFSYRIPVISTNVGGISEILTDGVNGYLLEDFNSSMLSNAILKVMNDKSKYAEMANASYETYSRHFDLKANLSKFESIVDSVAAKDF